MRREHLWLGRRRSDEERNIANGELIRPHDHSVRPRRLTTGGIISGGSDRTQIARRRAASRPGLAG